MFFPDYIQKQSCWVFWLIFTSQNEQGVEGYFRIILGDQRQCPLTLGSECIVLVLSYCSSYFAHFSSLTWCLSEAVCTVYLRSVLVRKKNLMGALAFLVRKFPGCRESRWCQLHIHQEPVSFEVLLLRASLCCPAHSSGCWYLVAGRVPLELHPHRMRGRPNLRTMSFVQGGGRKPHIVTRVIK